MKQIKITFPNGSAVIVDGIQKTADFLGVTRPTIYNALRTGRLGHMNIYVEYWEKENNNVEE